MNDAKRGGAAVPAGTEVLERRPQGQVRHALLVIEGPDRGARRELDERAVVVGSGADSDWQLGDRSISSVHLKLASVGAAVQVEDLGSTNGTYYLGSRIAHAELVAGAVLTIGRSRIAVTAFDPAHPVSASARSGYGAILGKSLAMQRLFGALERVEALDYGVLIHGETGTGKELVAREIHNHSSRREQPYVVLDCTVLPSELAESQMFGHRKGAFTGADRDHPGVFERARGGTVFIDEIGELPALLQPKLLRVLETGRFTPVGGTDEKTANVRVVAASHRDLSAEVDAGRFREDLYFRVGMLTLPVPPLRERREDIPLLVAHFLRELKCPEDAISAQTLELFTCGYDWPGNVRELRNALAQVVALGELPQRMRTRAASAVDPAAAGAAADADPSEPLIEARKRVTDAFERDYLRKQLERAGGNIAEAARLSGVDRSYLRRMLARYGLLKG